MPVPVPSPLFVSFCSFSCPCPLPHATAPAGTMQGTVPHEFHIPSADSSYGNACKEQRKSCKNSQKIWLSRWQHAGKCHQNDQPVRDGPCPHIHDRRQKQSRKKESQPDHATFPCSCRLLPVPAPLPPPVPRPDPSAGA